MTKKKPLVTRIKSAISPWLRKANASYHRRVFGMNIAPTAQIALSARLDKTNPRGVYIGEDTIVTFEACILTHDFLNAKHLDTRIGKCCFIGARSIIYPGVTIGDHCIVSAASFVIKDVPPNSFVAGNPARVFESNIRTGPLGRKLPKLEVEAGDASGVTG